MSEGDAYAHNLFVGKIVTTEEPTRQTPYHPAHVTTVAGLSAIKGGDDRFFNNLFVGSGGSPGEVAKNDTRHRRVSGYGLWVYDLRAYPLQTGSNVLYNHAQPDAKGKNYVVQAGLDPKVKLVKEGGQFTLHLNARARVDAGAHRAGDDQAAGQGEDSEPALRAGRRLAAEAEHRLLRQAAGRASNARAV
jgi:hypothetical protein